MKNLMILVLVVMLSGCLPDSISFGGDKPGEEKIEEGAVTADAGTYFRNPSLYLGKPVYLYLREVQGPTKERVFMSLDERPLFQHTGMIPTAKLLDQWLQAGLDPDSNYTVTFRVTTTIEIPGTPPVYKTEFDRFIVNTEDGPSIENGRRPMNLTLIDSLPQERVKRPIAKVVKEIESIALHPERYVNGRVRSALTIHKDDLRVHDDKSWVVKYRDLNVLLPKSIARFDATSMPSLFDLAVAGTLESKRDGYWLTADQVGYVVPTR